MALLQFEDTGVGIFQEEEEAALPPLEPLDQRPTEGPPPESALGATGIVKPRPLIQFEDTGAGIFAPEVRKPVQFEDTGAGVFTTQKTTADPAPSTDFSMLAPLLINRGPDTAKVAPSDQPSFVKEVIGGTAKGTWEVAKNVVGGMAQFATLAPIGVAGLAKAITSGPEAATASMKQMQAAVAEFLNYEPPSEGGKAGAKIISDFFNFFHEVGQQSGDITVEKLTPTKGETLAAVSATVGATIAELLPLLFGVRRGKPGTPIHEAMRRTIDEELAHIAEKIKEIPPEDIANAFAGRPASTAAQEFIRDLSQEQRARVARDTLRQMRGEEPMASSALAPAPPKGQKGQPGPPLQIEDTGAGVFTPKAPPSPPPAAPAAPKATEAAPLPAPPPKESPSAGAQGSAVPEPDFMPQTQVAVEMITHKARVEWVKTDQGRSLAEDQITVVYPDTGVELTLPRSGFSVDRINEAFAKHEEAAARGEAAKPSATTEPPAAITSPETLLPPETGRAAPEASQVAKPAIPAGWEETITPAEKIARPVGEKGVVSPKEQKRSLLESIDDAMVKAPTAEAVSETGAGKVTIHVPGDGTFRVLNTQEALTAFKDKVESEFPGTVGRAGPPKPAAGKLPRPTGRRITGQDVEYTSDFNPAKAQTFDQLAERNVEMNYYADGFWSNGHMAVKTPKPTMKTAFSERKPPIQKLIDSHPTKGPATITGVIKPERLEEPIVVIESAGREPQFYQAKLIDTILEHHPTATPFVTARSALIFKVGKEPVAIVEGMRMDKTNASDLIAQLKGEGPPPKSQVEVAPAEESSVTAGGAMGFTPKGTFRRPTESGAKAEAEIVRRSQIIKDLAAALNVPIRIGRFRDRALGIFKVKPEVVRSKLANDVETISHEVGHLLHKRIFGVTPTGTLNTQPFNAFRDELIPIATKPKAGQAKSPEGFAEFIRMYITDDVKAQQVAPKFYQFFDGKLKADYPEIREALQTARADYDRWLKQPATARVLSQISVNEKTAKGISASDIYTATVDDLHPLEQAVKAMRGKEEQVFSKDPYVLARLFRGWWGKADAFLEKETFNYHTMAATGKPLKEILGPIASRLDEFRAYMVSRRALELQKRGMETGILPEDAAAVVSEQRDGAMLTAFSELTEYQDRVLQYARDAGVVSAENYKAIKELNEDYVPFYRVMEYEGGGGGGKGFGNLFNPVRRIKGSARDIVDPLESVIKNTYALINVAERNGVSVALADLATKTHGAGKYMERIPTPQKTIGITNEEIYDIFREFASWKETKTFQQFQKEFSSKTGIEAGTMSKPLAAVEKIVKESLVARGMTEGEAGVFISKLQGAKGAAEVSQIVEKVIEKQTILHTVKEMQLNIPEFVNIFRPSLSIPKDAPIMTVLRNGKPEFYELTPKLHQAMLALNRENVGMLVRLLAVPARLLRVGATLAPEFSLRNPLRDQFMAFVQSKYGYVPGVDFVRGLFHVLKKDDLYWAYKKSGAEHSALVSLDRDYLQQNLRDLLAGDSIFIPETIRPSIIRHPIELLRVLSELGEAGTRLGEFQRAMKLGGSAKEALARSGYAAREVTLDFGKLGGKTQAVTMITAFWNARVQGLDKIVRTFKDNPAGATAKTLAAVTIPSVLLWLENHDDKRYQELPQWQKDLFWIVLTDDRIYRIPKPFELGILFGSFPERILDKLYNDDPEAITRWAQTFLTSMSPGFIPTIAVPLIENFANYSMFTDRPIVPKAAEDLEPGFQSSGYTSEISQRIGEAINYSPAKIDNLIRGYTGGLGMLAVQGVDEAFRQSGISELPVRPARGLSDIPGIRGFVLRFPTSNAESVNRFYEQYETSRRAAKTFLFLQKSGREADAKKYLLAHKADIEVSGALDTVARGLTNYHQLIRGVYNDKTMDANAKSRMLDQIYWEMIAITQRVNAQVRTLRELKEDSQ